MICKIYDSISSIEQSTWDKENSKGTILDSWSFLQAVELARVNDSQTFYLQTYLNGVRYGRSVCTIIKNDLDVLSPEQIRKIAYYIRKVFPNFLTAKFIIGGIPIAICTNNLSFKKIEDVSCIIVETERLAKENKAQIIVFKDFNLQEMTHLQDVFKEYGFWPVPTLPEAIVDLRVAENFEAFLQQFRKKYQSKIKKDLEGMRQDRIEVKILRDYGEKATEFIELYKEVYSHSKTKFEVLNENFVRQMSILMRRNSFLQSFSIDGRTLALEMILEDGSILRPLYIGIDSRKVCKNIYFYCLISTLKYAIENGFKEVRFGQNSYEAKTRFGAVIQPLFMFVKHTNTIINKLMYRYKENFFPETKIIERRIFK